MNARQNPPAHCLLGCMHWLHAVPLHQLLLCPSECTTCAWHRWVICSWDHCSSPSWPRPCSPSRVSAMQLHASCHVALCWLLRVHEADGCALSCDLLGTIEKVLAFLQSLDSSFENKYFVPSEIQFSVKTVFIKYFHAASG